jgi:hypothetical protein
VTHEDLLAEIERFRANCPRHPSGERAERIRLDFPVLLWISRAFGDRDLMDAGACVYYVAEALQCGLERQLLMLMMDWRDRAFASLRLVNEFVESGMEETPETTRVLPELFDAFRWLDQESSDRFSKMPYDEFLRTPYWKFVRRLALDRDGHQCRNCTATTNLHVHHRTYEFRGRDHEHLDALTTLCADCHAKFHNRPLP